MNRCGLTDQWILHGVSGYVNDLILKVHTWLISWFVRIDHKLIIVGITLLIFGNLPTLTQMILG